MKRLCLILVLLTCAQVSLGQLSGALSGIIGPGDFYVEDTIWVEPTDTLTMLPGTIFRFHGLRPFNIYGVLLAEGTETDAIIFTGFGVSVLWRGLCFSGANSTGSRLSYCTIEHGRGYGDYPYHSGGGINCFHTSPSFSHCTIRENTAGYPSGSGGGIWCGFSSPTFLNCLIIDNEACVSGGGVGCADSSSPEFTNCVISNNETDYYLGNSGAGVYCDGSSAPVFTNCMISYNTNLYSRSYGGGICCDTNAAPIFTNCLIYNNTTRYGGGAYCRLNATPAFIYCTFYGNSARNDGGGIYCHGATPILTGTNIAFSDGDGIYFQNSSGSSIEYCNLFGNNTGDFSFFNHDPSHGPTSIGALTTLNANSDSCDMYFNISEDPRFVNTAAEDFHLDEYSRCIGAANPANPTPTDMDGNPRPNPPGSHPDIGPYESGLNSPAPLEGLAGALNGTLGPGTYSVVDVISISAEDSLRLLPGTILSFTGAYAFNIYGRLLAEGTENDSIIFTTDTIANPERWRDLRFFETTSSPSRLAYCRIENGYQPGYHGKGGSVYCENSSPSFIHCHYSDNKAAAGGAVYCGTSSAPVFENCTFTNNSADDWGGYGGAVYCSESSPSFMNCSFTNNSAGDGGAINCDENSSPDFTNCRIRNNFAYVGSGVYCFNSSSSFAECTINHNFCDDTFWGGYGGGVYGYHSSVTFEDCTIDSNAVYGEGGGILCYKSSMEFNRCTICNNIVGNEYDGYGGAIMCFDSAFVSLTNCVLASNQAGVGGGIYCSWASLDLTNCTLYNNSNTGIYCYSNYALTINSTIVAFCGDYGIYFGGDSIQSQILYCDFHGNGGLFLNDFGGQVPNNLSIITTTNTNNDSCDIFYNIYSDPSFADINTNDFHLADFSRCIGAGDAISCPETDIEGNPRPNPPDSHPDIGAFENPRGTPLDVNTPPSNLLPPTEYALHPNWPNPFNPITTFSYDVKQTSHVRIIIYNLLGQETARLIDEQLPSGSYRVAWNAANLPSGLYLCQMKAGDFVQTRKMVLLK